MTRTFAALAALAALAACKSRPAAQPDAAPPDAAPDAGVAITGRELVRQVANDAQHLPQVTDVTRHVVAMTAIAPDHTATPVAVGSDGSFAFTTASPDVRLAVVRDGAPPVEYQVGATHLDLGEALAGRYDRVAPGPGTSLVVAATGATAGTAVVDSTGLWTQTGQPTGSSSNFTLDWTRAGSLSGGPGLLDAGANDRVYVTFENAVAGGYDALNEMCSADVTMTGGAPTTASCTSAALALDRCVHLQAHLAAESQRLSAALPAATPYPSAGYLWLVAAIPAPQLGPVGALWLAWAGGQSAPAIDLDANIAFANPFPGHASAAMMAITRTRSFALPGANATTLGASTLTIVAPASDCTTPTAITGTVAIAAPPALDGLALDHDGVVASIDRGEPQALAWDLAAAGAADTWSVGLYHVTASGGQTEVALQRTYVTADRRVAIDPAEFTAGETYLIELEGFVAFPGAAMGDFRTSGYPAKPYAESTIWSGSFEITD